MANDIKLKIDGDAQGLLAAVKSAMAQIEQDSKKLKLSPDAAKTVPHAEEARSFIKSNQEARAQVQKSQGEQNNLKVVNQLLKEKAREFDELNKKEKKSTEEKVKHRDLAEEILGYEKQRENTVKNIEKETQKNIKSYKDLLSNMAKAYGAEGMAGVKGVWGGMSGLEKVGFSATSIGGVLGAAGIAMDYMGRRPIDITRMQGSAISMTTGRQLAEARSGEYTYEGMYGTDRQKAKEQAASSRSLGTGADWLKLVGGGIALAGGIASIAAAIPTGGASLAALPAIASGVGIGGAAALAGGAAGVMSGMKVLDPQKYAAYRSQQEASDFTTMLAGLHEIGPYRKDAIERLKGTATRDLGMERTLGLKDFGGAPYAPGQGGYLGGGGYLKSQMDLGFTDDMVTKASAGILGAGGSTAMALQSGTALQAERGLGLTNAQDLLGQLSGTQSIPETSKKSLIDIFARGFDASKYAEENRKYMQAVTEQVYKGGTTSTDATDKIADLIRAGIGGTPTSRNIEGSKSAYESYKASGSALSGYAGGINVADAMDDPWLKNVTDPGELQEILKEGMDIDENSQEAIEFANRKGMPSGGAKAFAADMRKRFQGVNKKQLQITPGMSGYGKMGRAGMANQNLDTQGRRSIVKMIEEGDNPAPPPTLAESEAARKLADLNTGKTGDTNVQTSAMNAKISLETLSASINKFADDAMAQAKKLGAEAPAGRASEDSRRRDQEALDAYHANSGFLGNFVDPNNVRQKNSSKQPQGN